MKNHLGWICVLWLGLGVSTLQAKGPGDYQVGEVVSEDVVTPVALDVVDAGATSALKASQAAQVPAVFKSYTVATNTVAAVFNTAFETAHSNFLSAVQDSFHQATLDQQTASSQDFGYLLTAFNIKNKDFPVTSTLALDWALGKGGNYEKKLLLGSLLWAVQYKIRPDEVPDGFGMGDVVRVIPADEHKTGPVGLQGKLASKSDILTISQARMQFRKAFSGYDEEPLSRALSLWLKANCIPDAELTRQAREQATSQLVVTEHYAAGQVIAQQGAVVDDKMKAAFEQLQEKLASAFNNQPVAVAEETKPAPVPVAATMAAPAVVQVAPVEEPVGGMAKSNRLMNFFGLLGRYSPAVLVLAGISIAAAAICVTVVIWKLILRRPKVVMTQVMEIEPTTALQTQVPMALQTALAPELVQAVRHALVHELAGQRRELLVVQQNAAVEVSRLVRKMDELQMELQERLRVYELQIQRLETDLAARTEENQQLIKMKIEMIRVQRESETAGKREELIFT